ncbi:MAG: ABC transporter substrate-binding protein [Thermodesulfobacteriota bacterium]|nr:ABC transporter substrate-binding protein [Thermodesulfobacteriota bacterium]
MKKRMLRRYVFTLVYGLVILYAFFASTSVLQAKDVPGLTKNTIKVGLILDQTGPAADVVVPTTQGIKTYFRYVNEQGGIFGRTIDARVEDDRYSIPLAITAFKKLVFKDRVFSLIGPTSTGAVTVLSRHVEKQKIPLMSAIMPEITVKPFKKYVFIFGDIYPNQMKVLIEYILKDVNSSEPRIAFVYPDNETGKVDLESATRQLAFNDLQPVSKEVLNPGSLDAASQIMSLRRAKANFIVLCGQIPQPTAVLLRELKKFGLNIPVFGSWATCAEEVLAIAGKSSEKFYAVNHMMSWYDEGPGAEEMRNVTLKYYPGTEKPYRGKIYTHGWVGAKVMVEILKRAGKNLNRENFIQAMETIKDFETGDLCGPINYSPTNHKGGNTWKIFKADPKSGKFIPITGWRKSE